MHCYLKIAQPVPMRFHFRLHRRLPNTVGNARRTWFGSNPSAGRIVMTIPTLCKTKVNNNQPFKISGPVPMRFRFRLHRRLPNTVGNAWRTWFGSNPSVGRIVMTIPTLCKTKVNNNQPFQNLWACANAISLPTARTPSKHCWQCMTHLVWFKSVGGKNSYDYSNHHVNWGFLICMVIIKSLSLCLCDFTSDCTDAFQTLLAMDDALGLVQIRRREK